MPKMDGYTAIPGDTYAEQSQMCDIPIIAMTANAFEEDRKKAGQGWYEWSHCQTISADVFWKIWIRFLNDKKEQKQV